MFRLSLVLRRVSTSAKVLLASVVCFFGLATLSSAQVRLIIDTDTATDCDDAGALAVAHALQNRRECVILAVIVNNSDPYSVGAVDAINTWFGRGNIPLGAYKGSTVGKTGSYRPIAENTALYGHDVVTSAQVPDAVTTYRTVLAAQPDASVVIASIGWLNNLEDLLKSPADAISPLTGQQLVAAKVKSISIMGGRYPSGSEYNFSSFGSAASTRYFVENWPDTVPVMFQGYEIGDGVTTGPSLLNTPASNPVRKAYEIMYDGINGRPSWDPCAILHAVRGLSGYWAAETIGSNTINTDGSNAWVASPDKNQAYSKVLMSDSALAAVIGDLMDDPPLPLSSRFPVKVIFDTDYSTDCDDPGALAVLHALADNGEAEILATGTSTGLDKAPGAIDVVNTYYGRPGIPISATKAGPTYPSAYAGYLYDNFPHDTPLSTAVEDAVVNYRRVLAAQPDDSVVLITVGYLTNVAELLKSPADQYSPLTGMELVTAKVKEWACMGGNFWTSSTDNVNFSRDAASAQYAIANFPKKLTFIPREVASVPSPLRAGEELNQTPLTNPVRIAYHQYFGKTTGIDRHCADLATVLYAVRGNSDYWDLHTTGSMTVINSNGTFTWDESVEKDHNYLVMKGGYGAYTNAAYVEGVMRNLLKQTPAIVAGVHAPSITGHPQNISVSSGKTASFSVVATANPAPTYQWLKNGAAIPGATGSVYTTPATTAVDNGAVYRVAITNTEGTVFSNAATLTVLSATSGLISPWAGADVGTVGLGGRATYSNGTFTVSGAGADIGGTADAFYFVSRPISGDCEIRARVVSQANTDPWAKAGVMIRETSQAGSAFAFMGITPGNGFRFQTRLSSGTATSSPISGGALATPPNNWVRLVRIGNTLTGYSSADGVTWTQVSSATVPMAAEVRIGLVVSSHDVSALSSVTFDSVELSGGLIAYYSFDEASGPIVNQGAGGSALNLTNTGGTTGRDNTGAGGYGAIAYPDYGTAFDVLASGNNTYHTTIVSNGGGLLTSGAVVQSALQGLDGAFTYEALISVSDTTGEQNILAHDGPNTARGFLLRVLNGTLSFYTGSTSFAANIPTSGAHGFVANHWFHVAVTYSGQEGSAGNFKLYWTALDAPVTAANLIGTATLSADLAGSVSNFFGVGTTTRDYFRYEVRGLVDEVGLHGLEVAANKFAAFVVPPVVGPVDTSGDGIPDSWATAHGFDPASNIAQGDPDFDGISNLMEFALNLDPRATDTNGLPVAGPVGGYLTMSVPRNPGAAHLQFVPEVSSDLVNWQSGTQHVTIIEDAASVLTAVDKEPISGSSRRFMRLRVRVPVE